MVYDLLTSEDKARIEDYINEYGYNRDYSRVNSHYRAPLNVILNEWNKEKSEFLGKIFDKSLTYEKEIEYIPTEDELVDMVNNNGDIYVFLKEMRRNLYECCTKYNKNYINVNREDMWAPCFNMGTDFYLELTDCLTVANNIYNGPTVYFGKKDEKAYKVQKGCKAIKVFRYLANYFGMSPESFEKFRIAQSKVNDASKKGTLVISIDPADYITMSDNECNWDSCMAWREPGSYRMGTVEMMNSPYVVVCYLKAAEDMYECGHNYSNKRWRILTVVSPESITTVKGYPYSNAALEKTVITWLKELVESKTEFRYENEIRERTKHTIPYKSDILRIYYKEKYMYSDFGRAVHYFYLSKDIDKYINKKSPVMELTIPYSGRSQCMWCGDIMNYVDDSEQVFCGDCLSIRSCSNCGDHLYDDDDYYTLATGETVCTNCYENNCYIDEVTGENYYINDLITIYFKKANSEEMNWDYNCSLIRDVVDYYAKAKSIDDIYTRQYSKYFNHMPEYDEEVHDYYIREEWCTERGLELFKKNF